MALLHLSNLLLLLLLPSTEMIPPKTLPLPRYPSALEKSAKPPPTPLESTPLPSPPPSPPPTTTNSSWCASSSPHQTTPPPPRLTLLLSSDGEITIALRHLRSVNPDLARVIDSHQPPSFQNHYSPFHSLARSILYQQLAMKAASSIYGRFISLCGGKTNIVPEAVLALTPQQLCQIGVSFSKAGYLHDLASKYCGSILSNAAIIA